MSSVNHFFLDESILVKLTNVFPGVNFISTCLGNWNDKASSQAAAHQHCHNTEVEDHGAVCVHVLWTGHTILSVS